MSTAGGIDLIKPQYSQSTFYGRVLHFVKLTSPLNLFVTDQTLNKSKRLVESYQQGRGNPFAENKRYDERSLWKAKYLIDATFHPDTKEKILLPFRMSSFVPTNLLVTAGLLLPNATVKQVIFWQWVNQSVNVGINWANANKSTQMTTNETLVAYLSAVFASVTVAVGLNRVVRSPLLSRFVPFVAVASAGALNVFLMRRKELTEGIDIYDDRGNLAGKSQTAGMTAISQVAISRIATSLPCLTIPPLVLSRLEKYSFFTNSPTRLMAANLGLITICLMTALPCAIALFPQNGRLRVDQLEPELQKKLKGKTRFVTYNKGL
ncbi:hypothetical protein MIR68_000379 [Amoeboaphelidium protococcarum]|nr:hypothetical protein MIR68_000379 [Amoeboaphelidium protococcarum]